MNKGFNPLQALLKRFTKDNKSNGTKQSAAVPSATPAKKARWFSSKAVVEKVTRILLTPALARGAIQLRKGQSKKAKTAHDKRTRRLNSVITKGRRRHASRQMASR